MRRLRVVVALALVPALVAASARRSDAAGEHVSLRYAGYWRALRVLALETDAFTGDTNYVSDVRIRTEGLVGLVYPWQTRTRSVGVVVDGHLAPRRVETEGRFRSRDYRSVIEYLDSGELAVQVEPAALGDYEPVPAHLRRATIDPQTATLSLIRRLATGERCTGTERVFDGRLRYDVEYVDHGSATVERSRGALYTGPARLCEAVVHPLAGLSREERAARDRDGGGTRTALRYWLAPVIDGVAPVPVRLDLSGVRGTLHLHLTEARTLP